MAVEAWGFVTKHESEAAVVQAIRDVASDCAYFSPDVKARLVVDRQGVRLTRKLRSRASTLSQRELEVLQYLTRGMSKKEIARTMHISENTVHRHTTSLMAKLDIHDRVELARFAIREGLVEV
jgi:DNA-binding NarL/FixJ family response regulator